jgi:hypothetical protein
VQLLAGHFDVRESVEEVMQTIENEGSLVITCAILDMNHNDAFSAMRIEDDKNFLRIRIKGEDVEMYSIGLKKVPRRFQWRTSNDGTTYEPAES